MEHSHASARVATLFAAAMLATACDPVDMNNPASPSSFRSSAAIFTLAVEPVPLFPRSAFGTFCPFGQPFFVPFNLMLGTELEGLFLNQVRVQFIDSLGTAGPRIAIPQVDLINRFDTIQIPPFGFRTFPFSFDFGCATRPFGNLFVFVEAIDGRRTIHQQTLTVAVR
jgi:hypothetical protein